MATRKSTMPRTRKLCWSYGGGVQSVAIAVLVVEGALPVPDLAMIADTGREKRTTWDYLREVVQPYLSRVGLTVQIAPHSLASADLYAPSSDLPLVPAWTRNVRTEATLFGDMEVVDDGRLPSYCSGWWKRDVCERWLRSQGVEACDCWIGYSTDERWRVKDDHRKWCHYTHPLIDLGLSRAACVALIEKAGLPPAHKSRCFDCPHQTPEEWLEVRASPDEWALAVERDQLIRDADERNGLFLYSGRVPLPLADFRTDAGLAPVSRPCESAGCWT